MNIFFKSFKQLSFKLHNRTNTKLFYVPFKNSACGIVDPFVINKEFHKVPKRIDNKNKICQLINFHEIEDIPEQLSFKLHNPTNTKLFYVPFINSACWIVDPFVTQISTSILEYVFDSCNTQHKYYR